MIKISNLIKSDFKIFLAKLDEEAPKIRKNPMDLLN